MTTYDDVIEGLETELCTIYLCSSTIREKAELAIGHCINALESMREHLLKEGFKDKASEIQFFKEFKPTAYSRLLYYQAVLELERNRLELDNEATRQLYLQELDKILEFMTQNQSKVQYYRGGFTHLDEEYFVRDSLEIAQEQSNYLSMKGESFLNWHDHTFSTIMANERLIEYIQDQLDHLDYPDDNKSNHANQGVTS